MRTHCLVNIHHTPSPADVFWDHHGCFGPFTLPGLRWPSPGWSIPGSGPSTTHSLLLTPLDPEPSGGSLCLWGTPDGSAPVCPRHSLQTESFTEHPQASQYLNHLKFKQWAQAVQLASLSETHSVGLTMSRQTGHTLNVLKLHGETFCMDLNLMTPCNLKRWLVLKTAEISLLHTDLNLLVHTQTAWIFFFLSPL